MYCVGHRLSVAIMYGVLVFASFDYFHFCDLLYVHRGGETRPGRAAGTRATRVVAAGVIDSRSHVACVDLRFLDTTRVATLGTHWVRTHTTTRKRRKT